MVHIMDGSRKEGRKNLQVCEHGLEAERRGQGDTGVRKMGSHTDKLRDGWVVKKDGGQER